MKISIVTLFLGLFVMQNLAHAQVKFYPAVKATDQEAYTSTDLEDYSAHPITCARNVIIADLQRMLIGKKYTLDSIHLKQGIFQTDSKFLAPDASDFKINFTANLYNSSDRVDHPVTGTARIYYSNQIDSSYHGTSCKIFDGLSGNESDMDLTFDETGADALPRN
jgi:hypothetical protein